MCLSVCDMRVNPTPVTSPWLVLSLHHIVTQAKNHNKRLAMRSFFPPNLSPFRTLPAQSPRGWSFCVFSHSDCYSQEVGLLRDETKLYSFKKMQLTLNTIPIDAVRHGGSTLSSFLCSGPDWVRPASLPVNLWACLPPAGPGAPVLTRAGPGTTGATVPPRGGPSVHKESQFQAVTVKIHMINP